MFTDIVGYSKLMNTDESRAMKLLGEHDELGEHCINKFNGRLIKKIGDANFIEFQSSLDAVNCALEFQKSLRKRNQETKNNFDRVDVRIGIHVGDIIEKDGDLFGDGVNLANRIVSVANAGEICISKEANASIQGQKEIISASIGKHDLKNIVDSWDLYRIFINDREYSNWAEDNYQEKESFKVKSKLFKKYIFALSILLFLIINTPIVNHYYNDWSNKKSITELSEKLGIIYSTNRKLNDVVFIKTKEKDIYFSIKSDFLYPPGKFYLKGDYDESFRLKKINQEIKNILIPLIELMNGFDGNIEISANSDSDKMPKSWRKTRGSNEHLSGTRSASLFKYLMKNGLDVNNIKIKNLLWGSYKPYSFIDLKTIPTWKQILKANPDIKTKAMNRRVDFHFFYD